MEMLLSPGLWNTTGLNKFSIFGQGRERLNCRMDGLDEKAVPSGAAFKPAFMSPDHQNHSV
jgi:hypothetical protein